MKRTIDVSTDMHEMTVSEIIAYQFLKRYTANVFKMGGKGKPDFRDLSNNEFEIKTLDKNNCIHFTPHQIKYFKDSVWVLVFDFEFRNPDPILIMRMNMVRDYLRNQNKNETDIYVRKFIRIEKEKNPEGNNEWIIKWKNIQEEIRKIKRERQQHDKEQEIIREEQRERTYVPLTQEQLRIRKLLRERMNNL